MHQHEAYMLCYQHVNKFVRIHMHDGVVYEGVIEKVDYEHVYIACPIAGDMSEDRYFPYPGFGYGYGPFGYPRFNRFALPLVGLTALSLLPFTFI